MVHAFAILLILSAIVFGPLTVRSWPYVVALSRRLKVRFFHSGAGAAIQHHAPDDTPEDGPIFGITGAVICLTWLSTAELVEYLCTLSMLARELSVLLFLLIAISEPLVWAFRTERLAAIGGGDLFFKRLCFGAVWALLWCSFFALALMSPQSPSVCGI